MKGRVVGGEGKEAEVDGGYFGGYVKPANLKEDRIDRRFARNQNGKREVVVIVRERGGNSVPAVFNTESQAASFIRARIAKGTVVHADEAASWATSMSVSRSRESIIRRHTASMALALTWLRSTSHASGAPRSASITTSPGRSFSATRPYHRDSDRGNMHSRSMKLSGSI
jgi:hypothetical protein